MSRFNRSPVGLPKNDEQYDKDRQIANLGPSHGSIAERVFIKFPADFDEEYSYQMRQPQRSEVVERSMVLFAAQQARDVHGKGDER